MTWSPPLTGRRPRAWAVAVLVLLGVQLVLPSAVADVIYLVVMLGVSGVAWYGALRATGRHRRFALLVAAAVTAALIGDLVYRIQQWRLGYGLDVSSADAAWLGAYVFVAAALVVLLRGIRQDRGSNIEGMIDAAVVLVAGTLIVWELLISSLVADTTVPASARLVWTLYALLDIVLLTLVVRLGIRHRTRTTALVAAGAVCCLAADLGFLLLSRGESVSRLLDTGWLLGSILLVAGAVGRYDTPAAQPRQARTIDEIGLGRVAIALLPLMVPGLIELQGFFEDEDANPLPLLGATAVLLLLAFVRMARLVLAARTTRRELVSRERRSMELAANSSDAVVVVDAQRRFVVDEPRLADLVGYPGVDIAGRDLLTLVAPADFDEAEALFNRCLATAGQVLEVELRVNHGGGRQVWLGIRLVNLVDDPDVAGVVVNLHDISDRKQVEEQLGHQAFHDALTGLANRALFRDRLDHALDRNARTGAGPAVIFLDLDGFKTVNDSLGHDAGDGLLREVAGRLQGAVRRGDTVGRLGGDEFAILIEQSARPLDEATTVADRVLQSMTEPVLIGQHRATLSASLGIAVSDGDCSSASLLRDADVAMYQAKATGKGKWVIYDPGMRAAAVERLELENDLLSALDRDEFRLHYQPVVELETERVVGFEALLRWQHPTLGLLAPDRFIPLAEENGLIVPIGRWVLDEATSTAAGWRRRFGNGRPLTMAVNVSARQLASPELVMDVANALTRSGLEPAALVLEMTETVLVQDATTAAERLEELHQLGVRLAIDDFGTGYSSLSYLRQFPVDILKIDRSFINTITERSNVPAIVRGLLDLGRTLQLETVAEGVELPFQRNQLRDEHCDLAQGFLFARPLPVDEAEQLLADLALDPVLDPAS